MAYDQLMEKLQTLEGKKVKFGNDATIMVGNKRAEDIIINVKKGTEFIITFDSGLVFMEEDGWIKFKYDEQWITFDPNDLNSETWENGLSLLLIEI